MVKINGARLLESLNKLRTFGAVGNGVVRPTFSQADMAARSWLRDEMKNAGLDAVIDGVGNVFGRSTRSGPALLLGSHSDTQPEGGWLDGALGVMYAIEVARAVGETDETAGFGVDAVAWSDEEATYTSCLGSSSFAGSLSATELAHTNSAGESVAEAIARTGLDGRARVIHEPDRQIGYLEAHIEQGPRLEELGHRIGVVTTIVGIAAMRVGFVGEQNHAGTTPMARRRDAGAALFEFGVQINERLRELAGPSTVWTIGDARLEPGAESIIPGYAELTMQFRDPDVEMLTMIEATVLEVAQAMTAKGPVDVTARRHRAPITPTVMDPYLQSQLHEAAERNAPGDWIAMPSAAGHDPMALVGVLPCAMVFIPSIGGISHDFAEDSRPADIVLGCQVLADATVSVLEAAASSG